MKHNSRKLNRSQLPNKYMSEMLDSVSEFDSPKQMTTVPVRRGQCRLPMLPLNINDVTRTVSHSAYVTSMIRSLIRTLEPLVRFKTATFGSLSWSSTITAIVIMKMLNLL